MEDDAATLVVTINAFLRRNPDCRLSVSYKEAVDGYWCFLVHGDEALPGVSDCSKIRYVKLPNSWLTRLGSLWEVGFHGTTPTNVFLILLANGFDLRHSGDTVAGVCVAGKMMRTGSYDFGGVLQCSIHGFQHCMDSGKTPEKKARALAEFKDWSNSMMPIGMNAKWKAKGCRGGQLMCNPDNLCIARIYIKRNVDIPLLLSTELRATAGGCFKGPHIDEPQALFEEHLARGLSLHPPNDIRPLAPQPTESNPPPEDILQLPQPPELHPPPKDIIEQIIPYASGRKHTFVHVFIEHCDKPTASTRAHSEPAVFDRRSADETASVATQNESHASSSSTRYFCDADTAPETSPAGSWIGSSTLPYHPSAISTPHFSPTFAPHASPVSTHNPQADMTAAISALTFDALPISLVQSLSTGPAYIRQHLTQPAQMHEAMRRPAVFQEGDDRFNRFMKERVFACDSCAELFSWRGNRCGVPFDGDWTQPEPVGGHGCHNMARLWKTGSYDCTWTCTACKFDTNPNYDDIEKFRASISRDAYDKNRATRTKKWKDWQKGASPDKPKGRTRQQFQ